MNTIVATRNKILMLEESMRDLPQTELEVNHYFAHGTYTRELRIPKGVALTGKIHRYSCINILAQGKIRVVTEEDIYDIEAPYTFVSGPGIKKAGYALEDTVWLNVHPWDGEMTVKQLEHQIIASSYDALMQEKKTCLG